MFPSRQIRCCRRQPREWENREAVGLSVSALRCSAQPFTLSLLLRSSSPALLSSPGWLLARVAHHWNYPSTSCTALPFAMLGHGIIWIYAITMFSYGFYCMLWRPIRYKPFCQNISVIVLRSLYVDVWINRSPNAKKKTVLYAGCLLTHRKIQVKINK